MAVILYRYTDTPESVGSLDGFVDRDVVDDYVLDALHWAVGENLLTGKGGGRLDPAGTTTYAETAALLMHFAKKDA